MKFIHTLIINEKEIDIFNEALRLYRGHLDSCLEKGLYGNLGKDSFCSYRNKVISMYNVMTAVKQSKREVISESSEYNDSLK